MTLITLLKKRDLDHLQPLPQQEPVPALRGGQTVPANPRPAHHQPGPGGTEKNVSFQNYFLHNY